MSTKEQKIQGRKAELPALCFLNLSAHFYVRVTVWVKQFLAVIRCLSEEADPLLYYFGTPRFNNAHDVP